MGEHARRRHTPEQIIRKLREADRLLGEGAEVAVVAKQLIPQMRPANALCRFVELAEGGAR